MPSPQNLIRTWLQLLRAPNLLTVPGDPAAGYFLACFGAADTPLWPVIAASLCFYGGGLLLNDLADTEEDRRERPSRPLPSGAASPRSVLAGLLVLFAAGLGLCWHVDAATLAVGGALLAAITLYNLHTKRLPIVGALNMGACRALSMLLGATAVSHGDLTIPLLFKGRLDHLLAAGMVLAAFITAITHLARFETQQTVPAYAKLLPALALTAGITLLLPELHLIKGVGTFLREHQPNPALVSSAIFVIAAFSAWQIAFTLLRDRAAPVPPQIGNLIRLLLLLQAGFCAASATMDGMSTAVLLVLLWPIARVLSRWFYAS
jgi:4-hydroxybenzoate polyprenyltransferase